VERKSLRREELEMHWKWSKGEISGDGEPQSTAGGAALPCRPLPFAAPGPEMRCIASESRADTGEALRAGAKLTLRDWPQRNCAAGAALCCSGRPAGAGAQLGTPWLIAYWTVLFSALLEARFQILAREAGVFQCQNERLLMPSP